MGEEVDIWAVVCIMGELRDGRLLAIGEQRDLLPCEVFLHVDRISHRDLDGEVVGIREAELEQ